MLKYLKPRVKLVQNLVMCCRVWNAATANLRGEVRGKHRSLFGPESENSINEAQDPLTPGACQENPPYEGGQREVPAEL